MALIATPQQIAIANLYTALCNRAPDAAGFSFWVEAYQNGASLQGIAQGFVSSPEARAVYASSQSSAQFVAAVYAAVFGRNADAGGLAFWANALDALGGAASDLARAQVALQIIDIVSTPLTSRPAGLSDADYALTVADRTRFINKAEVGIDFAAEIKSNDVNLARQVMATVTDTSASVEAAKALARGLGHGGAVPVVNQNFSLTTGTDTFTGGGGNDTFTAFSAGTGNAGNTLNITDVLDGGAGLDTLAVLVTGTDAAASAGARITNIEQINLLVGAGATATFALGNTAGVTSITTKGGGQVSILGLETGAKLGIDGGGAANGNVLFTYANKFDAATLTVSGGTSAATSVSNITGEPATVNINSIGVANALGIVDFSNFQTITALNIDAQTDFTATLSDDYAASAALKISGAGKVNLGGNARFGAIDASASNGGLTMTLGTATTSFKGTSGNDTISTASLPAGASIDAGSGTDTLVVRTAADALQGGMYAGFEVLENQAAETIDAGQFASITMLRSASARSGFINLTAAQAATISVTTTPSGKLSYALANASGKTDTLGLTLKSDTAAGVVSPSQLEINGFENLTLNVGSGSKSLYDGGGVPLATAMYSVVDFDNATSNDLEAITITGDYAVQLNLGINQPQMTKVDASANTAGLYLNLGTAQQNVVATGTDARDIVVMSSGRSIDTAGGDDQISAYIGVASALDALKGGTGIDTLVLQDANSVALDDTLFTKITGIEKIVSMAGSGLTLTVGTALNALAAGNGGVLDVTASALNIGAGGTVNIDATGLSSTNSLKLNLGNVSTSGTGSISVALSQGADNIVITQTGVGSADTFAILASGASQTATTAKTVDLSGITTGAAAGNSVVTGAGADSIKAAVGVAAIYDAGAGADTITLGAGDNATQRLKYDVSNQSPTSAAAMDRISNFQMAAGRGDLLDFATTATLNTAQLGNGWAVTSGIATKAGGTLTDFISSVASSTTAGVVAFADGGSTYVAHADGTAGVTADDQIVQLVGLTGATSVDSARDATVIGIV